MPIVHYIPESFKEGFKEILSFDDNEFEAIQNALSSISSVLSFRSLVERISELNKRDYVNLQDIFNSVGSLSQFLEKDNVKELVETISDISVENEIVESKNKKTFEERLLFLLENKQIFCATRGQNLLAEFGNVFINTRIVTDIRPIFNINVDESPEGGMIIHNLSIHYHSDAEAVHKDIYFALDSDDIKMLKDALDRAEKKEGSLRHIFEKSGMTKIN